jgi:hypothetical protein
VWEAATVVVSANFVGDFSYLMMIIIIMMPLGREYVSELWLPTSLLLIPQVIHEHRKPWWNDIDR